MHSAARVDTWTSIWSQPKAHGPIALAGADYQDSARLYLAEHEYPGYGGGNLLRTDDGGTTWQTVLDVPNKYQDEEGNLIPMQNRTRPRAITLDPTDSDHVYVALSGVEGGILESHDAGATWTDLGLPAANGAYDVALGVDRRNLYAATDDGVLRLGTSATDQVGNGAVVFDVVEITIVGRSLIW